MRDTTKPVRTLALEHLFHWGIWSHIREEMFSHAGCTHEVTRGYNQGSGLEGSSERSSPGCFCSRVNPSGDTPSGCACHQSCAGRLLGDPQHQPGLHHRPTTKNNAAKANRKGGGTMDVSPQPLLPGQPWGEAWVWKDISLGGVQRHRAPQQQGSGMPTNMPLQRQVLQGLHHKPEAVVRMHK